MSKKHEFINAKRRGFIQSSVLVTGVAAGVAKVEANTDSTAADLLVTDEKSNLKEHAGYRETDQVREYYRKARF